MSKVNKVKEVAYQAALQADHMSFHMKSFLNSLTPIRSFHIRNTWVLLVLRLLPKLKLSLIKTFWMHSTQTMAFHMTTIWFTSKVSKVKAVAYKLALQADHMSFHMKNFYNISALTGPFPMKNT
jgi:hypothetical protein